MQSAHDLADHPGTLDVALFWPEPHLGHLVEDPPLDRLQPVPRIGQCARVDNAVGILQEAAAHFFANVNINDSFGNGRGWLRRAAFTRSGRRFSGHSPILPCARAQWPKDTGLAPIPWLHGASFAGFGASVRWEISGYPRPISGHRWLCGRAADSVGL